MRHFSIILIGLFFLGSYNSQGQTLDTTFTVYGPHRFERSTGSPVTLTQSFTIPSTAEAPYKIYIINGDTSGDYRISSATILINNVSVLDQNELNQQVFHLVKQVNVSSSNTIDVRLSSQPRSFIIVGITATDRTAPRVAITSPSESLITSASQVVVAGTVTDETSVNLTVNGTSVGLGANGALSTQVAISEGINTITVVATDAFGNTTTVNRTVIRQTAPPTLSVSSPSNGLITSANSIAVSGTATGLSPLSVTVNGAPFSVGSGGTFSGQVALTEGTNNFFIVVTDGTSQSTTVTRLVIRDSQPPTMILDSPTNGLITNQTSVVVSGSVIDSTTTAVTVNGIAVSVATNGSFSTSVSIAEGINTITVIATDAAGNSTTQTRNIVGDTQPPVVTVSLPANNLVTNQSTTNVSGFVVDSTSSTLTVNGSGVSLGPNGSFSTTVTLTEGANTATLVAIDAAGNSTTVVRNVIRDTQAPVVTLLNPAEGLITNQTSVAISGTIVDSTTITLTVNGSLVIVGVDGSFDTNVILSEGLNSISVTATDVAGNTSSVTRTVRLDSQPPVLSVTSPVNGFVTSQNSVLVSGSVQDSTAVSVAVNGSSLSLLGGTFTTQVSLQEGINVITVTATDSAGNSSSIIRTVRMDSIGPGIVVTSPSDGWVTNQSVVNVTGNVLDSSAVTLTVNGLITPVNPDGSFASTVPLTEGRNVIVLVAIDAAGNQSTVSRRVVKDTQAPAVLVISPVLSASTTDSTLMVVGSVVDSTSISLSVNLEQIQISAIGGFSKLVTLAPGSNTISIVATDQAGNTTSISRTIVRVAALPDPATVASSVDRTVGTTIAFSTEFLYTGTDPIQKNVASGTIDKIRISVLRGQVLDAQGSPLIGATVNVPAHPEYGYTFTRQDGMYDLAVNGGSDLTLDYSKPGFLSAQRTVSVEWQTYTPVSNVVVVPVDTVVHHVDFITPAIAQGTPQSDDIGTRRPTVFFEQGTQASLVFQAYSYRTIPGCSGLPAKVVAIPVDSLVAVNGLSVRTKEYSVGQNGFDALPAPLPATVAYSFAFELSADEVASRSAKGARLSIPATLLLENVLNFPVGLKVPFGFYDRDKASWLPTDDGRIIRILSTAGGIASVDETGDGIAEHPDTLALHGMSYSEQQYLATVYTAGQTLMRIEFSKLGTYAVGYGFVLPANAKAPANAPPDRFAKVDRDNIVAGSVIGVQNQTLGESVPVTNTNLTLNYKSDRVPGRREAYTLDIPLSGPATLDSVTRVELEVEVAGQVFSQTFTPQSNLNFKYEWDGKDVYGRKLQGQQNVLTTIKYYYRTRYAIPADLGKSFSTPTGQTMVQYIPSRKEMAKVQIWEGKIGAFDILSLGIGGWSISQHHGYDILGRIVYSGDGQMRRADVMDNVITTIAGISTQGINSACATQYAAPSSVRKAPIGVVDNLRSLADGSFLVNEVFGLRKIDTAGIRTTLAFGCFGGTYPDTTGGILANCSKAYDSFDMVEGPDKSIYVSMMTQQHIWRVTPDGELKHYAGVFYNSGSNGYGCFADGDGGPALQAHLGRLDGMAFGKDGSLYFADMFNHRIRKITPDGIITTVAGSSTNYYDSGYSGDGGPAINAKFYEIRGFAMGPDGSLFICDYRNHRVRKVTPDGIVKTIAGTGVAGFSGDGGFGIFARIAYPYKITVGNDGTAYFCETGGGLYKVRAITPDGYIKTVVGGGTQVWLDQGPATAAQVTLQDVEFGTDGALYVSDWHTNPRIFKVGPPLPGIQLNEILLASEDGSEQYVFTFSGRHLRTLDALTGVTKYTFNYDAQYRLTSIIDIDSLITQIERNTSGIATAIISPYGVRTELTIDTLGHLLSATNPANEPKQFTYTSGGLMTSMTDARNSIYHYTYDSLGYLIRDEDPVGGFTAIGRAQDSTGYTITATTAMGKVTKYRVDKLRDGSKLLTNTDPNGLKTVTTDGTNGTATRTVPDGTTEPIQQKPDPRFGMQSPLSNLTKTTPAGLSTNVNQFRKITQMTGNTVTGVTDSVLLNGKIYKTEWDGNLRRLTKTSPEGRKTFTFFDAKGKTIKDSTSGITATSYKYDNKGRRSEANQGTRKTTFEYDAFGRQSKVTDPNGRMTQFFYDAADRLIRTIAPDLSEVLFTYDVNGNMTSLTPPSKPTHTFEYSPVDLETLYTPPFSGDSARATLRSYTFDKEIKQILRPDSLNITIQYGGTGSLAGLPKKVFFDRGFITNLYDTTKALQIGVVSTTNDSLRYQYDGSLLKKITWSGANGSNTLKGNVAFSYNSDQQVTTESIIPATGSADSVNLKYDKDGLMVSAGTMKLGYSPANGLLTADTVGGVITNYTYSTFGELASKEAKYGATSLFRVDYVRDSLGRITEQRETVEGRSEKTNYAYDVIGRLSKVWRNDTLASEYSYDANGNRLLRTTPTSADSGMYDAQDRLLQYGNTTYMYSSFGDLRLKATGTDTTRYVYDAFGSLVSATLANGDKIEYLLDGNGLRVGRKLNGVLTRKWLYSNNLRIVAELDSANTITSRFVYTTSENVPEYMVRSGVTYRLVTDHLGSLRQVVNTSTGVVVEQIEYDEFGNIISDTNPGFVPFGFAGGLYDTQTKLVRFGARDYEAVSGRWLVKDPIRFESGQTNMYIYAEYDPLNKVDSKGESAFDAVSDIIGAIFDLAAFNVEGAKQKSYNAAAGASQLRFSGEDFALGYLSTLPSSGFNTAATAVAKAFKFIYQASRLKSYFKLGINLVLYGNQLR